jgi:hypothetical protein
MAPAGEVVGQHNVAGIEDALGTVAQTYLRLTLQSDYVLGPWGNMEVLKVAAGGTPELNPGGGLHGSALSIGNLFVWKLQFLKVGLSVVTSIKPYHLHPDSSSF